MKWQQSTTKGTGPRGKEDKDIIKTRQNLKQNVNRRKGRRHSCEGRWESTKVGTLWTACRATGRQQLKKSLEV